MTEADQIKKVLIDDLTVELKAIMSNIPDLSSMVESIRDNANVLYLKEPNSKLNPHVATIYHNLEILITVQKKINNEILVIGDLKKVGLL